MQLGLTQIPALRELFQLATLDLKHALIVISLGLIPVSVLEMRKLARRALA
jgi:hypothetical protein